MKKFIQTDKNNNKILSLYVFKITDEDVEIEISDEENEKLNSYLHLAYYENNNIIYKNFENSILKDNLENEKSIILQWFLENDWKVNKLTVGEWEKEDSRWIEYMAQRQEKRARLDQIEFEISMLQ
jgi:hypothetical protein